GAVGGATDVYVGVVLNQIELCIRKYGTAGIEDVHNQVAGDGLSGKRCARRDKDARGKDPKQSFHHIYPVCKVRRDTSRGDGTPNVYGGRMADFRLPIMKR